MALSRCLQLRVPLSQRMNRRHRLGTAVPRRRPCVVEKCRVLLHQCRRLSQWYVSRVPATAVSIISAATTGRQKGGEEQRCDEFDCGVDFFHLILLEVAGLLRFSSFGG